MTRHRVVFRREALEQLDGLYDYIFENGSPSYAATFTEAIVSFCESLADFPNRGRSRDDLRPGLRTIGFRKRVVVAYAVLDGTVVVIGIFYGGRDYEGLLAGDE